LGKGALLSSPEDVAAFMSRWGQLSRWIGDDGSRPYEEAFILLEPHLAGIRHFAGYVEAGDKESFCRGLKGQILTERANLVIDIDDPDLPLIVEAPSLLRFMLLEMWSEFGGERMAQWGLRNCRRCDRVFHVGGRRGTKNRRADSFYCSESCKNMASRARRLTSNTSIPQQ
jgi:hypothetical protein